jgi:hypothetical protein
MPYRASILLVVVAAASPARALPARGALLPTVEVDDVAKRRPRPLPDAHPVLVMYEDREAQAQNSRARAVLGRINDRAENRTRFEFVAVADVAAWGWWPARRYVLDDLRKIAARENTALFADWTGAVRQRWGLPAHRSALVLTGSDGRVRFAAAGTLTEAQLSALVAELQALGCRVD